MKHMAENIDLGALLNSPWLRDARASFDVPATLTKALAPRWSVHRETDPDGDQSIVVLPDRDAVSRRSFALYEQDGRVQVSTFLGEDWHSRQAFRTCQRAVAAIIAAAGSLN